ncbi:MAG: HEAT repeat domain-containing protein [Nitrospinae bacterium]|nr:HEAT repeat domain-containing protein [Nitrospinota bacterium]
MPPLLKETGKKPAKYLWGCGGLMAVFLVGGLLMLAYWLSPGHLVTMLNDGNPAKKRWAADTLIGKGAGAGATVLDAAADPSLDPELRRMAVFILGEMHYTAAEPRLIALMKGGDAVLGGQAAFALGRMGDDAALPELLGAYDGAPKGLKLRILAALGELGNMGGAELLKKEAARADDGLIQDTAHQAVLKMKEKHPDCCG